MKVLHVIPSLSRTHGGPTRALELMERALTAEGVSVETVTTDDDGPGQRNGKPPGQPLPENGVVHWYFAKSHEFYKPSPALARWIWREAKRFDLLHIHALFSFTTPMAALAARHAGVPYLVRPLGALNVYGMTQRRPQLKRLAMRFVDGPVLRHAAAVHFTSEQEAAEARRAGLIMREAVIPLAVETSVPQAARQGRPDGGAPPCILFLSRLDPKKNVEGLIDGVALLKDEMPSLRLVIAGDGPPEYVAGLKRRAEAAGLGSQVTWAGHIEGAEKDAAFADADIFALPSFSENFGIAAAEALAAGLPCVLGKGVAIAGDVADAGAGVVVGTGGRDIALGLRHIIADTSALGTMSGNARRFAQERYSMQAMGKRLKDLYTEILDR